MQRVADFQEPLNSEDVEWVVEWQLASCFPWLPSGLENSVKAAPAPANARWPVRIRIGGTTVEAALAVRDLHQVIRWCHSVSDFHQLLDPPRPLQRSLLGLRTTLRHGITTANPLRRMGYGGVGLLGEESPGPGEDHAETS